MCFSLMFVLTFPKEYPAKLKPLSSLVVLTALLQSASNLSVLQLSIFWNMFRGTMSEVKAVSRKV